MDVPPGYRLTTQRIIEGIASPDDYGPVDLNTVNCGSPGGKFENVLFSLNFTDNAKKCWRNIEIIKLSKIVLFLENCPPFYNKTVR